MKSSGRLQTGEHILAKILEDEYDCQFVMARFYEDYGEIDVNCESDLRENDLRDYQDKLNDITKKNLNVIIKTKSRSEAENEISLKSIPDSVQEVRIVEIVGFDKRPCRDPHVQNTKEIGEFIITKPKRVGKDRYRFKFTVS